MHAAGIVVREMVKQFLWYMRKWGAWSQKAFSITKIYLRKLSLKSQPTRLVERVLHSIGQTIREQGQRKAIRV